MLSSAPRDSGSSLLELLVSLSLSALVIAGCLQSVTGALRATATLHRSLADRSEKETIAALLTTICHESRTRYGLTPLIIARAQALDLLMRPYSTGRQLSPNADTITTAILNPDQFLLPHPVQSSTFCSAERLATRQRHFIALTADGARYVNLAMSKSTCTAHSSCPCSTEPSQSNGLWGLFPIRDAFTLYVDTQHTLRRHSLHAQEDQPIAYGIHSFYAKEKKYHHRRMLEVEITLTSSKLPYTRECDLGPAEYEPLDALF